MQAATDFDDYEFITDYSELSSEEIREKLVWHWLTLFRRNPDFELFCEAQRKQDFAACTELEGKFERVAELYDDWGDIHMLPTMHEGSDEWRSWYAGKRHLFFPAPIELLVTPVKDIGTESILAAIPTGIRKNQLLDLFDQFVDANPEILGSGPKYPIRVVKGESPRETLLRLEKADLVNDLLAGDNLFKYSHAEIAALVLKVPALQKSGFHWYPNQGQKDRIENGSFELSEVNSQKRTVVNLGKFYTACVASTVRGIFPA